MRRYEQVFILRPSLSEEQITKIIDTAAQLIAKDDGAVIFLNKWGMRKLAYPIKKESQGYYVCCDFASSPEVVAEIERRFRIDDAVLKYLTVKISDEIGSDEIDAARSDAAARAIVPGDDEEPEEKPRDRRSVAATGGAAERQEDEADGDAEDDEDADRKDEDA